jgi:hypothetical protein
MGSDKVPTERLQQFCDTGVRLLTHSSAAILAAHLVAAELCESAESHRTYGHEVK